VAAIGEVGQREDGKGRPMVGEMEQGEEMGMRSRAAVLGGRGEFFPRGGLITGRW
jgi:hypothetical protein